MAILFLHFILCTFLVTNCFFFQKKIYSSRFSIVFYLYVGFSQKLLTLGWTINLNRLTFWCMFSNGNSDNERFTILSSFLREVWRYNLFFLLFVFLWRRRKNEMFCCIFLSVIQNISYDNMRARERLSLDKPRSSNNNTETPNTKRTHFDWMRAHFSLDSRCMLFILCYYYTI